MVWKKYTMEVLLTFNLRRTIKTRNISLNGLLKFTLNLYFVLRLRFFTV